MVSRPLLPSAHSPLHKNPGRARTDRAEETASCPQLPPRLQPLSPLSPRGRGAGQPTSGLWRWSRLLGVTSFPSPFLSPHSLPLPSPRPRPAQPAGLLRSFPSQGCPNSPLSRRFSRPVASCPSSLHQPLCPVRCHEGRAEPRPQGRLALHTQQSPADCLAESRWRTVVR